MYYIISCICTFGIFFSENITFCVIVTVNKRDDRFYRETIQQNKHVCDKMRPSEFNKTFYTGI